MGIFTYCLFFLLCIGQDSVASKKETRFEYGSRRSLNKIQFSDFEPITGIAVHNDISSGGHCWNDGNPGFECDGSEHAVVLCMDGTPNSCTANKGVKNAKDCYDKLVSKYDACSTTFSWYSYNGCWCITKVATTYVKAQSPETTTYIYTATDAPTLSPTVEPTNSPTLTPTNSPTLDPTSSPTLDPTSDPTTPTSGIQFSDLTAVTDTSFGVVSGGGQCWYDGNHGAVCDGSEDQVWLCHDARWAGNGYNMNSRCGADKGVTSAEECYNKLVTQYDACSTTFVWLGSACLCFSKSATTYETHQDPGATSYRYDSSPSGVGRRLLGLGSVLSR
jgi:hypothetical protein